MEPGIDVGDLDRVAQIDASWTFASFLQRLGWTGRRAGIVASCRLLSTSDLALRDTLGRRTWLERHCASPVLGREVADEVVGIVDHLPATGVLSVDGDMLQLGPEAERRYGRRNHLDLTAVFADPPTLTVVHVALTHALGPEAATMMDLPDPTGPVIASGVRSAVRPRASFLDARWPLASTGKMPAGFLVASDRNL